MDLLSTSLEVIHLIYTTTVFIRDVTSDIKDYGDAKRDISEKLEHELVFVETFSDVCLDPERGFLRDNKVRDSIKRDVKHCLEALNKALAAYRAEAWKFAGVTPTMGEADDNLTQNLKNLDLKEEKKRWRDGVKSRYQVWRKKAAPLEWALFGKEEMEALLLVYKEWTDRLRQTLSIILLLVGTPTSGFATSEQAKDLGVREVSERQTRVNSKPPDSYDVLTGSLQNPLPTNQINRIIQAIYEDEMGFDSISVLVETRPYDEPLALATSERNHDLIQTLQDPLRQLTWLLQSPLDSNLSKQDAAEGYRMHTLPCLGFLDEPAQNRSLILYRSPVALPPASPIPSLHASISNGSKLPLGSRFLTARALAATLLTIHTSGWVHKNITSRGILLLPSSTTDPSPLPYLVGWDVARPLEAGTSLHALFELEPNLYRHEQRFGQPTAKFANEHDIYALGVVLLEIGLWKTMSAVFARPLEKNPRIETSQQAVLFKRVGGLIRDLAGSEELKREMGEGYAEVVGRCLGWRDEGEEAGILFRKDVVDRLRLGCKL